MLSSWLVSWRNLSRHKKRFLFTLIAIVLGVMVMTSMLIAKYTIVKITEEQEALYAGEADFWIQSNEGFFHENDISFIEQQEEIATGLYSLLKHGFVDVATETLAQRSVRFTGISDFQTDIIKLPLKAGDLTKEGLIITENAATLWNKEVGDIVSFEGMGAIEVTAIVYEGPMLNSPKTMEDAQHRDFRVIVPLETLQKWTGLENQISNYRFSVNENAKYDELLANYQSLLEGTHLFVQPVVVDRQQYNDVEGIYFVFDLISILAIFISAFIAFNMLHTSIIERKKEIGIMKSLGYTAGKIVRLFAQEITFLATIGTIFGISLGIGLGYFVQDILISSIATQDLSYNVVLAEPVIVSIIVGLLFPFIAATLPLYRAAKTPILEAMFEKQNLSSMKSISLLRIIIGIIFTGMGLLDNIWAFLSLFIGLVLLFPLWMRGLQKLLGPILTVLFGFSGKHATKSIKQFEKRNANTAAMLAIGVSLALFMSSALQSLPKGIEDEIRASYGGDIHLVKETPWDEFEVEYIREMSEVISVKPLFEVPNVTWYSNDGNLREFSVMSFSSDGPSLFVIEEEAEGLSEYPFVYLGNRALQEWGGTVGELITLNTPTGEQKYFVKGRVLTSHYNNYVAFAEDKIIDEVMNWPLTYKMLLDVADEENIPLVIDKIWNHFANSLSGAQSITTTIEKTTSGVAGIDDLMQGLLLLIIGISAIGISNTLFMNTMERIKEIGTMRALGFTKGQVRLMIIAEGFYIGIAGVVIGLIYGTLVIYLNSISTEAGGLIDFIIPLISLILAILGAILFTLLASWLPSQSASRISVKEAINYE